MNDILYILINFGGGKGGEASGTVVRFLLPTFFWLILSFISGTEWRRKHNYRDLFLAIAALVGTAREMLMFFAEFGSDRGYFNFDVFYRYYPPMEHAATMLVGVLIAFAFMGVRNSKTFQKTFLSVGIATTATLYVITAIGWPTFLLVHPKISFALYWGDMAFRVFSALILGTALLNFILNQKNAQQTSIPLISGIFFFFLDEVLMIINIVTSEQFVANFAPIRHNLHIWAVPFFIATYWADLKFQNSAFEKELATQHKELLENNSNLEKRIVEAVSELELRDWFNSGLNQLNAVVRNNQNLHTMADNSLAFIIKYIGASVGVFYLANKSDSSLQIIATYAVLGSSQLNRHIAHGEGLAGQVAVNHQTIKLYPVPIDYLPIGSALGESTPLEIIVFPILHNNELAAIIELGSFQNFTQKHIDFLQQSAEIIGTAVMVNHSHQLVNELLEQTQSQAEELRVQQEELQQTNEELSERAQMLAERGRQ